MAGLIWNVKQTKSGHFNFLIFGTFQSKICIVNLKYIENVICDAFRIHPNWMNSKCINRCKSRTITLPISCTSIDCLPPVAIARCMSTTAIVAHRPTPLVIGRPPTPPSPSSTAHHQQPSTITTIAPPPPQSPIANPLLPLHATNCCHCPPPPPPTCRCRPSLIIVIAIAIALPTIIIYQPLLANH